jgi:hypothetical protein
MTGVCVHCRVTRDLAEMIRVTPVDRSQRPFLVCKPRDDAYCFRSKVGPRSRHLIEAA